MVSKRYFRKRSLNLTSCQATWYGCSVYHRRYGINMKRFLAKYKTKSLRSCHASQCVDAMRHINDELINDTHTHTHTRTAAAGEDAREEVI
jgi:menaquinone-dependent protoporphyrinogen IX oxidase